MVTLQLTEQQVHAISFAVSRARNEAPKIIEYANSICDIEMVEFAKYIVEQLGSLPACLLTE